MEEVSFSDMLQISLDYSEWMKWYSNAIVFQSVFNVLDILRYFALRQSICMPWPVSSNYHIGCNMAEKSLL